MLKLRFLCLPTCPLTGLEHFLRRKGTDAAQLHVEAVQEDEVPHGFIRDLIERLTGKTVPAWSVTAASWVWFLMCTLLYSYFLLR